METIRTSGVASLDMDDDNIVAGLEDILQSMSRPSFIHVRQQMVSGDKTVLKIALRDPKTRQVVVDLAKHGYFQYQSREGESRFVYRDRIPSLWHPVKTHEVSVSEEGVYYTLEEPDMKPKSLLVIMSSMPANPLMPSLWRYFPQSYRHVRGYVPGGTILLRIADFGGVNGAFYASTVDRPHMRESITSFIRSIQQRFSIDSRRVVLMGSSKGGTGAVLHGVCGGWSFVAVDPVLSDADNADRKGDRHFTKGGVFPETKEHHFAALAESLAESGDCGPKRVFITAPPSAEFPIVRRFTRSIAGVEPHTLVLTDSRITRHPQVGKFALWLTVHMVVSCLIGGPLPSEDLGLDGIIVA